MAQENTNPTLPPEDDEIDLIALAKTVWNGRKTVIKTTFIFMVIGLFIAIFTPKEYTSSTVMLPQSGGGVKLDGNLGGLAAMAGINIGSTTKNSEIPATLYPQIVYSTPFLLELLKTPLTFKGNTKPITYENYYDNNNKFNLIRFIKKYTIGLPRVIIGVLKGNPKNIKNHKEEGQPLSITIQQSKLIKQLMGQISLDVNKKDGYISLAIKMPEALVAAQLTKKVQDQLQDYIISFKIKKSKEKLAFIKKRYLDKQKEFKKIQQQFAHFRDSNQNLSSAMSQTNLQSLQSEYDLTFSLYSELAKQLETQQIQVKEDTPVFTILKPVLVPVERTKPKRAKILLNWIIMGAVLGVVMVFGKKSYYNIKNKWNENE